MNKNIFLNANIENKINKYSPNWLLIPSNIFKALIKTKKQQRVKNIFILSNSISICKVSNFNELRTNWSSNNVAK